MTEKKQDKLPVSQLIGFALNGCGSSCIAGILGGFLTVYLTDNLLLSMGFITAMMTAARIINAVTEGLSGFLIDMTHTKMGKARPWILGTAFFVALPVFLIFNTPTSFSPTGRMIWVFVNYLLHVAVFGAVISVATATLLIKITSNSVERAKVTNLGGLLGQISNLIVSAYGVPVLMYFGGYEKGYFGLSLIFCSIGFILPFLTGVICRETPEVEVAVQWLEETQAACRKYSLPVYYLGHYLGAFGYCFVFGGTLRDSLWAGLLGLIIGLVNGFLNRLEVNPFFRTIAASFFMAAPAYLVASLGWMDSVDSSIIGALMILVPGLLITNSMRDIIYGDTNSGLNRIVQVLLSAFAIALGTAAGRITSGLYGLPVSTGVVHPFWVQGLAVLVGCVGFAILFNVHGGGMWLCTLGGVATWMVYLLAQQLGYGVYSMNFFATLVAALYAETMARIRKYPVTSYLVVSTFPLLPGAGIYYTMSLGLAGDFHAALAKGLETAGIAGCLAVGILLVSTLFRLPAEWKRRHGKN